MPTTTEKQFEAAVVEYAKLMGWITFHAFDARRSSPGYPDCTFVRWGRLVFAELKTEKGKVTAAQSEWLDKLAIVARESRGTVEVHLFRPAYWPLIERVLGR